MNPGARLAALSHVSLRWKLPALVALVLATAVAVFGAVAHSAVKKAAVDAAQLQVASVAQQFAQLSKTGFNDRLRRQREAAAQPALLAALHAPDQANPAALEALGHLGPDTGQTVAIELRDRTGRVVRALTPTSSTERAPITGVRVDQAGFSPLYLRGDSLFYDISAPVLDGDKPVGHLVAVRTVISSKDQVERVVSLFGPGAALLIGNADGSVWTDLIRPIKRPPPSPKAQEYERDGQKRLGSTAVLDGTPWVIGAEFAEARVLEPVNALIQRFVIIAAIIIAVGALVGWLVSRSITLPLRDLTTAAEAISAGDMAAHPVVVGRDDEIGRLARSFGVMATAVRASRENLEHQIADRTAELKTTLVRLEETQDELVRKERLAILGQLSSGVGHELRNPLGVMTNAVYYLEATGVDAPPKTKEYLGILRGQIRLAEKIVSDLLDFARVKPPQLAHVAVSKLIDDQLARVTIPSTVRIERDLPATLPALHVDAVQVGQVLLNLVTNAVQAMEEKGGVLTLRASGDNGKVSLVVRDSGPGIAPEHLDKVFEALFTTKARGIGLGLSVSLSLARANGGDITVTSTPGQGAAFTLDLPTVPAA